MPIPSGRGPRFNPKRAGAKRVLIAKGANRSSPQARLQVKPVTDAFVRENKAHARWAWVITASGVVGAAIAVERQAQQFQGHPLSALKLGGWVAGALFAMHAATDALFIQRLRRVEGNNEVMDAIAAQSHHNPKLRQILKSGDRFLAIDKEGMAQGTNTPFRDRYWREKICIPISEIRAAISRLEKKRK